VSIQGSKLYKNEKRDKERKANKFHRLQDENEATRGKSLEGNGVLRDGEITKGGSRLGRATMSGGRKKPGGKKD